MTIIKQLVYIIKGVQLKFVVLAHVITGFSYIFDLNKKKGTKTLK